MFILTTFERNLSDTELEGPFTHFWCDFTYKTRLTLPCTNVFFVKLRVDWKESYHIISRHPSFQFLLNWRYSVAELRDYKPVRGRLWQVLFAKSHQNRIEIAWKIVCVNGPWETRQANGARDTIVSLATHAPSLWETEITFHFVHFVLFSRPPLARRPHESTSTCPNPMR